MRSLIVNADDLGWSVPRNDGILEAHARGIVTAASLLATGPALDDALRRLPPTLDAGLHFNLSEGEPLSRGHRTLVGPDGRFLGKQEARRRAASFAPDEVVRELDAQLDRLGRPVSHLDAHHHLHVYGGLLETLRAAALRRGIRHVRIPHDVLPGPRPEAEEYRALAPAGPVAFAGVGLSGRLTFDTLADALRALPDGVTELMVHPGRSSAPDGFDGPAREEELRALTDPRLPALLSERRIALLRFRELP
jgi:predicted glycoside hydrolase/deacetylase ChbG (UPF0249 family)